MSHAVLPEMRWANQPEGVDNQFLRSSRDGARDAFLTNASPPSHRASIVVLDRETGETKTVEPGYDDSFGSIVFYEWSASFRDTIYYIVCRGTLKETDHGVSRERQYILRSCDIETAESKTIHELEWRGWPLDLAVGSDEDLYLLTQNAGEERDKFRLLTFRNDRLADDRLLAVGDWRRHEGMLDGPYVLPERKELWYLAKGADVAQRDPKSPYRYRVMYLDLKRTDAQPRVAASNVVSLACDRLERYFAYLAADGLYISDYDLQHNVRLYSGAERLPAVIGFSHDNEVLYFEGFKTQYLSRRQFEASSPLGRGIFRMPIGDRVARVWGR